MKVLVVEDSEEMRGRVMRSLASMPEVEVVGGAVSNDEALAEFERCAPEVVTLDISLRDGVSLRTLRTLMKRKPPPLVIVLTNHASAHYRERYLAAGARHFLRKSDLENLVVILRASLEGE